MLKLTVPAIGDAETRAAAEVLSSGDLVYGKKGMEFERRLAEYLGAGECIVVSSGTAALHLSLLALEVGPGDAVAVPDYTFPATANAVALTGARPVPVDVTLSTYCMDPRILERLCETWAGPERLRALMPVHQFGCPAPMEAIGRVARQHGLAVVEDAACALGTATDSGKAGTVGDLGCFSFHPRKILTTGEGGAVVTDDGKLADRIRILRNHGMARTAAGVDFVEAGLNYRLTDIQSAIGIEQLDGYEQRLDRRRRLKGLYLEALAGIDGIRLPDDCPGHVWQTFLVLLPSGVSRPRLMEFLRAAGVESSVGAQSVRRQSAYREMPEAKAGEQWNSDTIADHGLALPFCEAYGVEQVEQVVNAIRGGLQRASTV